MDEFTPTINDIGREVICLPTAERGILTGIRGTIAQVRTEKIVKLAPVDDVRLTLRSVVNRTKLPSIWPRPGAKDSTD